LSNVIVKIGDNCVSPNYNLFYKRLHRLITYKSMIVKIYETAMFLALLDDKVNKYM